MQRVWEVVRHQHFTQQRALRGCGAEQMSIVCSRVVYNPAHCIVLLFCSATIKECGCDNLGKCKRWGCMHPILEVDFWEFDYKKQAFAAQNHSTMSLGIAFGFLVAFVCVGFYELFKYLKRTFFTSTSVGNQPPAESQPLRSIRVQRTAAPEAPAVADITSSAPGSADGRPSIRAAGRNIPTGGEGVDDNVRVTPAAERADVMRISRQLDALEHLIPRLLDEMDARTDQLRTVLADSTMSYNTKRGVTLLWGKCAKLLGRASEAFAMNHGINIGGAEPGGRAINDEVDQMWFGGFPGLERRGNIVSMYAMSVSEASQALIPEDRRRGGGGGDNVPPEIEAFLRQLSEDEGSDRRESCTVM